MNSELNSLQDLAKALSKQRKLRALSAVPYWDQNQSEAAFKPLIEGITIDWIAVADSSGNLSASYQRLPESFPNELPLLPDQTTLLPSPRGAYLVAAESIPERPESFLIIGRLLPMDRLRDNVLPNQFEALLLDAPGENLLFSTMETLPRLQNLPVISQPMMPRSISLAGRRFIAWEQTSANANGRWIIVAPKTLFKAGGLQMLDLIAALLACLLVGWLLIRFRASRQTLLKMLHSSTDPPDFDPSRQTLSPQQTAWLFQFSNEPMLEVTPSGLIKNANAGMLQILGIDQVPTDKRLTAVFPEAIDWWNRRCQSGFEPGSSEIDVSAGKQRKLRLSHRANIAEEGKQTGMLFSARPQGSSGELLRRIETLSAQKRQLESLVQQLQQTQSTRNVTDTFDADNGTQIRQVIHGLVHEIKNPLGIMSQGLDYIADDSCDPEQQKEVMQLLQNSIQRMDQTLMRLIGYANPVTLDSRPCDVRAIIDFAFNDARIREDFAHIQWVLDIPESLPLIQADESRIQEALTAVLLNACQAATPKGKVTISSSVLPVGKQYPGVGARREDYFSEGENALCVEIRDTGPGLLPEQLNRIMQPFYSTRSSGQGLGLGLPLARKIIDAHRGLLRIESTSGEGTVVRIFLPLAPQLKKGQRAKVLLIDDDVSLCQMTKLNLERTGQYSVKTAYLGESGLQAADAESFDLIITDYNIPDMKGPEVIEGLRRRNIDAPILLFSIFHDDNSLIDAELRRKTEGVITKPINHAQMLKTIETALRRFRQSQSAAGPDLSTKNSS